MAPESSASAASIEHELLLWWRYYNDVYAGGAMREPVLRVGDGSAHLGSFDIATRTLTIEAAHIAADDWLSVMETLRHEMAHQYAAEVLHAAHEPPHGPAFRSACEKLRADPRARAGADRGEAAPPQIIDRIHKLLSLSSSPNRNEAQVALEKARELLLKHNLDAADLAGERGYGKRTLGAVRGRHHEHEKIVAAILTDYFFVSSIWSQSYDAARGARGTVLCVFGTPANLAMAEYVYGFLMQVAQQSWEEYRASGATRGDRERLRYLSGVMNGFWQKLRAQDRVLRRRHALVWRGDARLESFVRWHHPHTRSTYTYGAPRTRAYEAGVAAGRALELRRPLGGERGGFGGYLPG